MSDDKLSHIFEVLGKIMLILMVLWVICILIGVPIYLALGGR